MRRAKARRLTAGRAALAARWLPLAAKEAKRIGAPRRLWDEINDGAVVGLCEAAAEFDPRRRLKFSTFATWRIRGAAQDVLRSSDGLAPAARGSRLAARPRVHTMGATIMMGRGEESFPSSYQHADSAPPPDEAVAAAEERAAGSAAVAGLPTRLRRIVTALYVGGATERQIAAREGLSDSRITQLLRLARGRIGRALRRAGFFNDDGE